MANFEDKHICSKCKHSFEWIGYYLENNQAYFGLAPKNIKNITKSENGEYLAILSCPNCGHNDSEKKRYDIYI